MRLIVLAIVFSLAATGSAAQSVEIGGGIASGCVGSDGSACGNGTYPVPAAHVSWWATDRIELSGRVARIGLQTLRFDVTYPSAAEFEIRDRSRQFASALVSYHFRPEWRVRPVVGLGTGAIRSHMRVRCVPGPCSDIPGAPPEGETTRRISDVILTIGLSGRVAERWTWRAGCLSHRFANDENSVVELLAGVGYRFGR